MEDTKPRGASQLPAEKPPATGHHEATSPLAALGRLVLRHPLVTLLSSAVAVVVATTATVGWFYGRSAHIQELIFEQKLDSQRASLGKTIADLTDRLTHIERHVGGASRFLDVSRLSIPEDATRTLDASYKGFLDGAIYIRPPVGLPHWDVRPAAQSDLTKILLGEQLAKEFQEAVKNQPLASMMNERNGQLWVSGETVTIPLSPTSGLFSAGTHQLRIAPCIFVMPVSADYIARMLSALAATFDYEQENEKKSEQQLADAIKALDMAARPSRTTPSDLSASTQSHPAESKAVASANQAKALDKLSLLTGNDTASVLLIDAVTSQTMFAGATGAGIRVPAVEKKGNVFYLWTQAVFAPHAATDASGRYILDTETLFVGTGGGGGILIRIIVPSRDGRSDAFVWTQSWLASLRVPLRE